MGYIVQSGARACLAASPGQPVYNLVSSVKHIQPDCDDQHSMAPTRLLHVDCATGLTFARHFN